MGKSTMATMMCAGGAQFLTDDVARVDLDKRHPMVWPGGVESRLRPDAALMAADGDPWGRNSRATGDGRTAVSLPFWDHAPVSLDAVVIPIASRAHSELRIEELNAANALVWMGSCPRIAGWTDNGIRAQEFIRLAALARRVPVYVATVPWGPPSTAWNADGLLENLGW